MSMAQLLAPFDHCSSGNGIAWRGISAFDFFIKSCYYFVLIGIFQ